MKDSLFNSDCSLDKLQRFAADVLLVRVFMQLNDYCGNYDEAVRDFCDEILTFVSYQEKLNENQSNRN